MKLTALVGLACLAVYCELLYRSRVSARPTGGIAWSVLLVGLAAAASIVWTGAVGWFGMKWIMARMY